MSTDDDTRKIGELRGLEARFDMERLFHSNDLATDASRNRFKNQIEELIQSDDPEVTKLAMLGQVFDLSLNVGGDEEDPTAKQTLRESLKNLRTQYPNDRSSVIELVQIAAEFRRARFQQRADELVNVVREVYRDSDDETISRFVAKMDDINRRNKYNLSGSFSEIENLKQQVLKGYSKKADALISALESNAALDSDYLELVNCMMMLTQAGFSETTKQLVEKCRPHFTKEQTPAASQQRFSDVSKVVDRIGAKLEVPGPLADKIGNTPTVLCLSSPEKARNLFVSLSQISKITQVMADEGKVQLLALFLDDGQSESTWSEFETSLSQFPQTVVHRFNAKDSSEFLSAYPISWLPTWILLDEQGTLTHVSPPVQLLEMILFNLVDDEDLP